MPPHCTQNSLWEVGIFFYTSRGQSLHIAFSVNPQDFWRVLWGGHDSFMHLGDNYFPLLPQQTHKISLRNLRGSHNCFMHQGDNFYTLLFQQTHTIEERICKEAAIVLCTNGTILTLQNNLLRIPRAMQSSSDSFMQQRDHHATLLFQRPLKISGVERTSGTKLCLFRIFYQSKRFQEK